MNEEVFRKKSLDKIKSPESLNDYVRVSNPGVWLLLAAAVALLVGACVWGIFGHLDTTVNANVFVTEGEILCYVGEDDQEQVKEGCIVKLEDCEGVIVRTGVSGTHGMACLVEMDPVPKNGVYAAEVVVERIRPISFLTN